MSKSLWYFDSWPATEVPEMRTKERNSGRKPVDPGGGLAVTAEALYREDSGLRNGGPQERLQEYWKVHREKHE